MHYARPRCARAHTQALSEFLECAQDWWRPCGAAAAGLRQVRLHDLRLSFASSLLAAGVDVAAVNKAPGHRNPHITFTVYAHALPKERQGAGDAFGRLMAQSGNKIETLTPETASAA